jgi:hypothetical protein
MKKNCYFTSSKLESLLSLEVGVHTAPTLLLCLRNSPVIIRSHPHRGRPDRSTNSSTNAGTKDISLGGLYSLNLLAHAQAYPCSLKIDSE